MNVFGLRHFAFFRTAVGHIGSDELDVLEGMKCRFFALSFFKVSPDLQVDLIFDF